MLFSVMVTLVWFFLAIHYVFWFGFDDFFKLKPNELGDFFAGLFAPLVFLWIIYGYIFQQKAHGDLRNLSMQSDFFDFENNIRKDIDEISSKSFRIIKRKAELLYKDASLDEKILKQKGYSKSVNPESEDSVYDLHTLLGRNVGIDAYRELVDNERLKKYLDDICFLFESLKIRANECDDKNRLFSKHVDISFEKNLIIRIKNIRKKISQNVSVQEDRGAS